MQPIKDKIEQRANIEADLQKLIEQAETEVMFSHVGPIAKTALEDIQARYEIQRALLRRIELLEASFEFAKKAIESTLEEFKKADEVLMSLEPFTREEVIKSFVDLREAIQDLREAGK